MKVPLHLRSPRTARPSFSIFGGQGATQRTSGRRLDNVLGRLVHGFSGWRVEVFLTVALATSSAGCGSRESGRLLEIRTPTGRTLAFDPASSEPVLALETHGGLVFLQPRYELFGDGRLVITDTLREKILGEATLGSEFVTEILVEAIDSGLAEFDPQAIRERLAKERQFTTAIVSDAPGVFFELSLARYSRRWPFSTSPFHHRFSLGNPRVLSDSHPTVQEYGALARIQRRLSEESRRLRAVRGANPAQR